METGQIQAGYKLKDLFIKYGLMPELDLVQQLIKGENGESRSESHWVWFIEWNAKYYLWKAIATTICPLTLPLSLSVFFHPPSQIADINFPCGSS